MIEDTRRKIPEIVAALATFIADPEPYLIDDGAVLDLRALAAKMQILPAVLDMGGCLGLLVSGAVASFLWDEPNVLRPELEVRICNLTYYQASLKYPTLTPFVPRRPVGASVCSHCGGSGRCSGLSEHLTRHILCYCGGLGWLPHQAVGETTIADKHH